MTITQCSECGGKVSTRVTVCPHCGCPVEPEVPKITCPDCGEDFEASLAACPACGGPVEAAEDPRELSASSASVAVSQTTVGSPDIRREPPVPVSASARIPETDLWTLYTSLQGRISRKTYWLKIFLPITVASFLAAFLDIIWGNWDFESAVGPLFGTALVLTLWPGIAGTVKRLHDRDMTGWHLAVFWGFVISGGVLAAYALPRGGSVFAVVLAGSVMAVYWIYLVGSIGFLPGTEGKNSYGAPPFGAAPQSHRDAAAKGDTLEREQQDSSQAHGDGDRPWRYSLRREGDSSQAHGDGETQARRQMLSAGDFLRAPAWERPGPGEVEDYPSSDKQSPPPQDRAGEKKPYGVLGVAGVMVAALLIGLVMLSGPPNRLSDDDDIQARIDVLQARLDELAARPDGPFEGYYENGQLERKGTFAAGELDGPFEGYFANGQLWQKSTHVAGQRDGPYEFYNENGQLRWRGTFNMGEQCGEWIEEGETVTYPPCPPGGN